MGFSPIFQQDIYSHMLLRLLSQGWGQLNGRVLPTAIWHAAGGSSPHATDAEQPLLLHALLKSVRCRRIQVTQGKLHDRKILYSKKGKQVSSQRENIRESPQWDGEKPGKKLEAAGWKRLRGVCKRQILRLQRDRARNLCSTILPCVSWQAEWTWLVYSPQSPTVGRDSYSAASRKETSTTRLLSVGPERTWPYFSLTNGNTLVQQLLQRKADSK